MPRKKLRKTSERRFLTKEKKVCKKTLQTKVTWSVLTASKATDVSFVQILLTSVSAYKFISNHEDDLMKTFSVKDVLHVHL